jgi:hypothetical protein
MNNPGLVLAEREGFEPSVQFPTHMISSHADSAWLSHLSTDCMSRQL